MLYVVNFADLSNEQSAVLAREDPQLYATVNNGIDLWASQYVQTTYTSRLSINCSSTSSSYL